MDVANLEASDPQGAVPSASRGSILETRHDGARQQLLQPSGQSGRERSVNGQHRGQSSAPSNIGLDVEESGDRGAGHTISQALQGDNTATQGTKGDENNQELEADVLQPCTLPEPSQSGDTQGGMTLSTAADMAAPQAPVGPAIWNATGTGYEGVNQTPLVLEPPSSAVASQCVPMGNNSPSVSVGILTPSNSVSASRTKSVHSEVAASGPPNVAGTSSGPFRANGVLTMGAQPQEFPPTRPVFDLNAPPHIQHQLQAAVQQAYNANMSGEGRSQLLKQVREPGGAPHAPQPGVSQRDTSPQLNATLQRQILALRQAYVEGLASAAQSNGVQRGQEPCAMHPNRSPQVAWGLQPGMEQLPGPTQSQRQRNVGLGEGLRVEQGRLGASASEGNAVQDASVHGTLLADDALSDADTNLSFLQVKASQVRLPFPQASFCFSIDALWGWYAIEMHNRSALCLSATTKVWSISCSQV